MLVLLRGWVGGFVAGTVEENLAEGEDAFGE